MSFLTSKGDSLNFCLERTLNLGPSGEHTNDVGNPRDLVTHAKKVPCCTFAVVHGKSDFATNELYCGAEQQNGGNRIQPNSISSSADRNPRENKQADLTVRTTTIWFMPSAADASSGVGDGLQPSEHMKDVY